MDVFIIWCHEHGDGFQHQYGIFSSYENALKVYNEKGLTQERNYDIEQVRLDEFLENI